MSELGTCAMNGCYNTRSQKNAPSLFRFPKNKDICQQWVEKCKSPELTDLFLRKGPENLYKNHRVCSDHFLLKNFRNKNLFSQGIYPGSIPLLMNKESDSLKEIKSSPNKRKIEDTDFNNTTQPTSKEHVQSFRVSRTILDETDPLGDFDQPAPKKNKQKSEKSQQKLQQIIKTKQTNMCNSSKKTYSIIKVNRPISGKRRIKVKTNLKVKKDT